MKFFDSFSRRTVLAGVAAGVLGVALVLATTKPEHPEAAPEANHSMNAPGRQVLTCSISTRSVKQLAVIDTTSEGGFQCLGVSVEGDTVTAVRLERHSFTSAVGQPVSEQIKIVEFPAAVVDSVHGAIIDGVPGHDAIILRGHFSPQPGKVELDLSYLFDGFTGTFHSCPVTLDSTAATGWRLINRFDQTISHIVATMHRVPLIGVIGIADLEGACTAHNGQARTNIMPDNEAIDAWPRATPGGRGA